MIHFKSYLIALLIIAPLLITACGQTGDLYLPEDEPEEPVKEKSKK